MSPTITPDDIEAIEAAAQILDEEALALRMAHTRAPLHDNWGEELGALNAWVRIKRSVAELRGIVERAGASVGEALSYPWSPAISVWLAERSAALDLPPWDGISRVSEWISSETHSRTQTQQAPVLPCGRPDGDQIQSFQQPESMPVDWQWPAHCQFVSPPSALTTRSPSQLIQSVPPKPVSETHHPFPFSNEKEDGNGSGK